MGIPVYISPYWLVFAVVLVVMYANSAEANLASTQSRYIVAAAFVLLLYVSVLVHELAHCVVARGFGLPVRRVLLYPLGGYSEIEQEPASPGREALISGAGPVVSLAIAGIGYLIARAIPPGLAHQLVAQLFFANFVVGIFNLLPGLPLDGGRIFRAGVWKITGRQVVATLTAAWAGRVLALILVGLALFGERRSGSLLNLYWLWFLRRRSRPRVLTRRFLRFPALPSRARRGTDGRCRRRAQPISSPARSSTGSASSTGCRRRRARRWRAARSCTPC